MNSESTNESKNVINVDNNVDFSVMKLIIIFNIIIIIIMYLYSAQYLHILQDSKRYLTNPTAQVQPQLTSN